MRGKLPLSVVRPVFSGITPAGAGKTTPPIEIWRNEKDHPRRCGENDGWHTASETLSGSPPQVRGKPTHDNCRVYLTRITPAGAGKTGWNYHWGTAYGDHPRRCGENIRKIRHESECAGSPPQVRGKQEEIDYTADRERITPAGAGKTEPYLSIVPRLQDHPRRCGENLHRSKQRLKCMRITPAGAGKTKCFSRWFPEPEDHPRRCGENRSIHPFHLQYLGSPPQVRGKHDETATLHTCTRITPAGAGKT